MSQITWSFSTASAGFVDATLPQTGLVDPMVIAFASDGRMFVAEKGGRILVFDDVDDPTATVVADLRVSVYNFWDRGMMGMALHPNFPATPYVYVLYALRRRARRHRAAVGLGLDATGRRSVSHAAGATTNGCVVTGRISRLDIGNASSWPLNHNHELPLVTDWFQQFPSHSIGTLAFGPDGALYASGGDGASFNYVDSGRPRRAASVNATGNHDPAQRAARCAVRICAPAATR